MNKVLASLLLSCVSWGALAQTHEEGLRLKSAGEHTEAAAVFEQFLRDDPNDIAALEALATLQGWLDRHDEAVTTWNRAIRLRPADARLRTGLARVLYWKGEREQALAQLDAVTPPVDQRHDVLVLRGDILIAAGRRQDARAAYRQALALNDTAELREKMLRTEPPPRWRVDAGVMLDEYSNFRGNEDSGFVQLGYQVNERLSLYGRYDHYNWFDTVDQAVTVGSYYLIAPQWLFSGEIGVTPDDEFRPETLLSLNMEWLLQGHVQPLLGYRYFDYPNGRVATLTPGLRLIWKVWNLELRHAYSENIDASETAVSTARLGWSGSARWSPYLLYATGDEALPPQPAAEFDVIGAGAVLRLTRAWAIRADYSHENRDDFYKRDSLGMAATYKF